MIRPQRNPPEPRSKIQVAYEEYRINRKRCSQTTEERLMVLEELIDEIFEQELGYAYQPKDE